MIRHRRRKCDTRTRTSLTSGWALWSVPAPARTFLLLTEAAALAGTVLLIAGEPASTSLLVRFGVLAVLGIGYSEVAAHSTRMQRYLGSDKVFSNPMSVWSYAAVLTVPAGWAAGFIAVQYAHAMWQRRRDATGKPYRVAFTAAATMLAQLAVAALVDVGDQTGGAHGHVVASLAALAGVPVFLAVNMAVLLTGMWLTIRPPSIRAMIPDADTLGYEIGTLVLGLATAEFVLHSPMLTPVTLILVALLHRSSVVKSLQKSVRTDAKTGLLTAGAWTDSAATILGRATSSGGSAAVLLIDLDHFKAVNDTYGHLAGDRVLVAVASCLRRELRGHDCVGRFGGEELVAILDGVMLDDAAAIANRIREAISQLRVDDGLQVTVSIGLAHTASTPDHTTLEELLQRADLALYEAKQSGRDRVRCAALPA